MVDQLEITERTETRTCDKHGDYEVKVIHLLGSDRDMGYCEQCADIQKADEEAKEQRRMTAMAADLSRRILPPRFHGCDFDGYKADTDGQRRALAICQKYANRWDDRKAKGGCLVLCGNPGTGKTHLAAAIVKAILPHEMDPRGFSEMSHPIVYTTATAMTRRIKATYAREAQETEQEVINRLSGISLLVVDEVGAQRGTETELLLIQEVIDNRYQRMLPTILISNLQESELSEYIGERALDRLYDNGGAVVGFDWGSKRRA